MGIIPVVAAKVVVGTAPSNGGSDSGNIDIDPSMAYSYLIVRVEAKIAAYENLSNGDLSTQTKVDAANTDKTAIVLDNLTEADKTVFQARIAIADTKVTDAEKIIFGAEAMSVQSISTINVNTVQVVLATTPTTDLTSLDASKFAVRVNEQAVVAPITVTKVSLDVTGKTYNLTINILKDKQSDIAVNGTKLQ